MKGLKEGEIEVSIGCAARYLSYDGVLGLMFEMVGGWLTRRERKKKQNGRRAYFLMEFGCCIGADDVNV